VIRPHLIKRHLRERNDPRTTGSPLVLSFKPNRQLPDVSAFGSIESYEMAYGRLASRERSWLRMMYDFPSPAVVTVETVGSRRVFNIPGVERDEKASEEREMFNIPGVERDEKASEEREMFYMYSTDGGKIWFRGR
jgi:hypothetical protein